MWLAVAMVSACGSVASGGTAAAHQSPTPDPEVARVKAAVTAFITAQVKSGETGDASAVEALTADGSTAKGNAGGFAADAISTGTGFKTLRLDIDGTTWNIRMDGEYADVTVSWSAYGYRTTYPGDVQEEQPHESMKGNDEYQLQEVGGAWLIDSFT
jgi:hypothetical protein